MSKNNTLNTTELMSGKDGRLLVELGGKNIFLAEVANFATNMNVSSVQRQPVGSINIKTIPTGVDFSLAFTEMVVRDDVIMEPMLAAIKEGWFPVFHFQGVMFKPDGQEERIAYNNCVPNGTFGLQNLTPGEVIEREQNWAINDIPEVISSIASTYLAK